MAGYDFFQNRECEYFPCHRGVAQEEFSCLFCFCPLYALGENCGGKFVYTEQGIKDCSGCVRPHVRGNYEDVCRRLQDMIAMVKKETEKP